MYLEATIKDAGHVAGYPVAMVIERLNGNHSDYTNIDRMDGHPFIGVASAFFFANCRDGGTRNFSVSSTGPVCVGVPNQG